MSADVVSAADFIVEPRELFEVRLPAHLRGHCPHVVRRPDGGEGWSWAGEPPEQLVGWDHVPDDDRDNSPRREFEQLPAAAREPAPHLEAMDAAGIDASVLFPAGLLHGHRHLGPEMRRAAFAVYNDWIGEFEHHDPGRLLAPRLLASGDGVSLLLRELDRVVDAGARAVFLPTIPTNAGPALDEFWTAVSEVGITVCLGSGGESPSASAVHELADRLAVSHRSIRLTVTPVVPMRDPVSHFFDRRAASPLPMYCANLVHQSVHPPAHGDDTAAANTLRAYDIASTRPVPRARPVRVRAEPHADARLPHTDAGLHEVRLPRVGILLGNAIGAGELSAQSLRASAQLLERSGFAGIWVGDVIGRRATTRTVDPLIALAMVAGVTERVELGTCVLQVPLRRPVELAHRLLSLHLLAGGRFTCGVGAGSTQADFDAVGVPFGSRFRLLGEALPAMKALWRGETVGEAALNPWEAALGGPPVLVGSWGGRWVERAAREFDGWIASGTRTWRALGDAIDRFHAAGGRRAVVSTVFADLSAESDPLEADDRVHLACSPAEARRRLQRLGAMGFADVIVINQGPRESLPELAALGSPRT